MCVCVLLLLLLFSCSFMSISVTQWIIARQAPLSMRFPRQEYWNGLSFTSPGDLPDPGTEPLSLYAHCCMWSVSPLCCLIFMSIPYVFRLTFPSILNHTHCSQKLCSPKAKPLGRVICTPVPSLTSCSFHLLHWASALSCPQTWACHNHPQCPTAKPGAPFLCSPCSAVRQLVSRWSTPSFLKLISVLPLSVSLVTSPALFLNSPLLVLHFYLRGISPNF